MKLKSYDELQFSDDYIFYMVMTQYEDICKKVVELCIGKKIHHIRYKDGQKTIKTTPESKGIRLDVYLEDDAQTRYDFEMQNAPKPFLGRRIRYYGSVMDIDSLQSGDSYRNLPQSYVVFICLFDPFEENRVFYVFGRREAENPRLELGDGEIDIVINAYGDDSGCSDEMRQFLAAVRGQPADHGVGKEIEDAVRQVKQHPGWRAGYMLYELNMMESREEGFAEGKAAGIAEGKAEGKAELLRELTEKMIRAGADDSEILQTLSVDAEEVSAIRKSLECMA